MKLGGTVRSVEDVHSLMGMGLQFGELSIRDVPEFKEHLSSYTNAIRNSSFFYLCHGPREGDPNDIDSLENSYLPKLLRLLPLAKKAGSDLLTIHLWMDPRFVHPEVKTYKIGFLKRLLSAADEYNIRVNIENLSESFEDLLPVFESLPGLGLTLDLGHAQLLSLTNRSLSFIENCPERIRHVHIHDNFGGMSPDHDLHLPIGEGSINFAQILSALSAMGYEGTMTLELRPHEIVQCRERVMDLLCKAGLIKETKL